MPLTTVDPSTGLALATYEETSPDAVDALLDRAHACAGVWRGTPIMERAEALRRYADALRARRDSLALLATQEMGKPLAESDAEVGKCVWCCEWFADHAARLLEPEAIKTEAVRSSASYVPLGVLFAIMPWNFPYWQVVRALAPALMAGNAVVLKHAPSTTGCALAMAELAGLGGLASRPVLGRRRRFRADAGGERAGSSRTTEWLRSRSPARPARGARSPRSQDVR